MSATATSSAPAHEHFSSRLAFLLAAIGTAVGLGNLWKFPYTLGQSGGAAFVVIYLVAIVLIATPIMLSEMIIGRRTGLSPPQALRQLAGDRGGSVWAMLGWAGIIAVFIVLSFFSVVAGWSLAYLTKAVTGAFVGLSAQGAGQMFGDFLARPAELVFWHALFMAITGYTVSRGITGGIERALKLLMPALFVLLIFMVIYGMVAGDFPNAINYLFVPRLEQVNFDVALDALGQAFFSVNVGIGSVLVYSAYLPANVHLPKAALIVATGDTLVALLAGLAIFPIVFQYGIDPAEGPQLIFVALSTAFGQMAGGSIIGALFFLLVFVAALTSAIGMLELMTSRAEESPRLNRRMMAPLLAGAAFLFGLLTVFSFNLLGNFHPLAFIPRFEGQTIFGLLDFSVTNVIMPLGGMLYALFAGWWISSAVTSAELELPPFWYRLWQLFTRFVAPIAIGLVFVFSLGG
ncbi:MAG: sodium-dependent transporter [Pseudomonadota bacterium]